MLSEEQLAAETDEGLNKRIPELPETAAGTDRATLTAVVYNPATNKTEQTPLLANDPASVVNTPLVKEDLTDLEEYAHIGPGESPRVFLGQYVSVKHYAKRGAYDLDKDRSFADLRFVENSNGKFVGWGNDDKGFPFGLDAVRVSGTPGQIVDSYSKLDITKPVKKGDKVSWDEIDGENRLYEARVAQPNTPVAPPTGAGDDDNYYAYSPVTQAYDDSKLLAQVDEQGERLDQAESSLDAVRLANYFQDQELVQHDTRIRSLSVGAQRLQNGVVVGYTDLASAYFVAPDSDQIFIPNTIVSSLFAYINKRVYVRGRVVNEAGGALVVSAGTVYWDGLIEGTSGSENDAVRILSGGRAYTRGIINGAGRFGIVNQGGYIEHVGDVYAGFLASVIHTAGTTIIRGKVYSTPGFNRSNVVEFRGGSMILDGGTVDSTLGGRPGTTAVFVGAAGLVLRNQTIIAESGGYALNADGVPVTVRVQGKFNYRGLIDPAITLEYDTEYSAFPIGEAGGLPPADSVTEAMLSPAVRTKLNAGGNGGGVSSDVFFKVSGGYQGNSVDTSMSLADSSQGVGFQTIPFSVVEADVKPAGASGGWDANTRFYTIGVAGLYQLKINLRPRDASTGTTPGKRYGIGVNTSNSDGPDFLWSQTLNSSNGLQNTVDKYLNAGEQVRGFCYLDGFGAGCGGMFSIRLIGAAK